MADLPHVIGLLHRADWTRLSLSAELRSENDRELSRLSSESWSSWDHGWPEQKQDDGRYVARGALLIGPGGRWRLHHDNLLNFLNLFIFHCQTTMHNDINTGSRDQD